MQSCAVIIIEIVLRHLTRALLKRQLFQNVCLMFYLCLYICCIDFVDFSSHRFFTQEEFSGKRVFLYDGVWSS